MQLMELPDEPLGQIVNHVGGPELRKDVKKLTISRKWFEVAIPIFLAGLNVSRIKLSATSLSKFPTAETFPLLELISHKTQHLTIRLLGHYWDSRTSHDSDDWNISDTSSTEDSDDEPENRAEVPDAELKAPTHSTSLLAWRTATNTKLRTLSHALANFTVLTALRFEFAAEDEAHLGPLWNYVSGPTLTSLLTHLPLHHALEDLTLDLCGTSINATETHSCRLVADLLPHLSRLRVRTRSVCPAILLPPPSHPSPRLCTLILKLHQPYWQQQQQLSGRCSDAETFCTRHCDDACERHDLHFAMYAAARKALPPLGPQLRVFRISYAGVGASGKGINVCGVDVLAGLNIGVPEEFFVYEDRGRPCWWEEKGASYGPFFCGEF